MILPLRRSAVLAVMAGAFVALTGLIPAQDENAPPAVPKEQPGQDAKGGQKNSGVIIKVEEKAKDASGGQAKKGQHHHASRLTINTAVPWRDWVRDQAVSPAEAESKAEGDQPKGKGQGESIATEGQPVSPENTVVVEVTAATKVETRYRSSTDEVSEGSPSPEGAADVEKATDRTEKKKPGSHHPQKGHQTKAERANASHLRPRQFVDVYYTTVDGQNHASRVVILKPIGGADVPAAEDQPEPKAEPKKDRSKKAESR